MKPRFWIAGGVQYGSGLPFEFDGDYQTALAEYGQQVLDRVNFARGRILPSLLLSASAGGGCLQIRPYGHAVAGGWTEPEQCSESH